MMFDSYAWNFLEVFLLKPTIYPFRYRYSWGDIHADATSRWDRHGGPAFFCLNCLYPVLSFLSCLAFFVPLFFLSVLSVCLSFLCVLSCLSCFLSFVFLRFCAVSCVFFYVSVLLPCATNIGGTEMERTCGRHVQMQPVASLVLKVPGSPLVFKRLPRLSRG